MKRRQLIQTTACTLAALALAAAPVSAAEYPEKPITLIVPAMSSSVAGSIETEFTSALSVLTFFWE